MNAQASFSGRLGLAGNFLTGCFAAGFLIAFWATPDMTVGHLLFAIGMTAYILIGIRYEERDLKENLGDAYTVYSQNVGMIIPGLGKSKP